MNGLKKVRPFWNAAFSYTPLWRRELWILSQIDSVAQEGARWEQVLKTEDKINQHQASKSLEKMKPWQGRPISTHCGIYRTPQRWGEAGNGIRLKEVLLFLLVCWFARKAAGLWPCLSCWIFPLCPDKEDNGCMRQGPRCSALGAISRQFISLPTVQCFPTRTEILPNTLATRQPQWIPCVFTGILTQKCASIGEKLKNTNKQGK